LHYYTTDGTAEAGADYATAAGARGDLVIPAGLDTGEISVYIADDDLVEGAETFTITLHNPTNAVIAEGAGTAVGTILDDEIARLAITDAQATESDGTIDFTVTATPAPPTGITVGYSTFDGTATQPGDYTATTATLRIHAGDTAATATVALTDDNYHEDPETFAVRLHNPSTGAEIDKDNDTAIGLILDDDDLPQIVTDNYLTFSEDEGTVEIQVTLNKPSDREIRIDYRAGDHRPVEARHTNSGNNGCDPPFRLEPGTLVFPPGAVAATIAITLVNDGIACHYIVNNPLSRTFRLYLENAENAVFVADGDYYYETTQRRVSIRVWDVAVGPCVAVRGPTGPERESAVQEGAGAATFTVLLNRAVATSIDVAVSTGDFSPFEFEPQARAAAGADYTALSNEPVNIPAGQTEAEVDVALTDDDTVEPTEGFAMRFSSTSGTYGYCPNSVRQLAPAYIIDDDTLPEITVADADVSEGAGSAAFNVSLDRASATDVTVRYATADGTAAAPGDYTAASGTLTIEAGATGGAVEVPVIDDDDDESDETFTLRLTSPAGATISDGDDEVTATIRDNDGDSLPVITIADAVVTEKDNSVLVTVTLSEPAPGSPCLYNGEEMALWACILYLSIYGHGHDDDGLVLPDDWVTVSYATVALPPGPYAATPTRFGALVGGDYEPTTGTVSFAPGRTEANLAVFLTQKETRPEFDEKFLVVLHDPDNATLGDSRAEVTITDNDLPLVTVADVSAPEGTGSVVFTVDLHAPGVYDASVRYRTVVRGSEGDAAATPDEDYADTSGTLDIPAGTGSATITVPITDDAFDEPDETFILQLYEPKVLTLEKASAIGTITDDDPGYWIDDDRSVWEYAGTMQFTVRRDHTSDDPVTVNYTVTGVSATAGTTCGAGVDYIAPSGTLTLAPTATSGTIAVTVCNDTVAESRETLLVELTGVPGRNLSATGTILDNDN
ncbi:MAG: hypothetical protein OXC06_07125, partial [Acidimicrobiaceae bacterium]|nr:hypothetical protein [Acidimicrobiaceae bacterium]